MFGIRSGDSKHSCIVIRKPVKKYGIQMLWNLVKEIRNLEVVSQDPFKEFMNIEKEIRIKKVVNSRNTEYRDCDQESRQGN